MPTQSGMFTTCRMQPAAQLHLAHTNATLPVRCSRRHLRVCASRMLNGKSSWLRSFRTASAASRAQLPLSPIASRRSNVARRATADEIQPGSNDGAVPLQVTRSNFSSILPVVQAALQDCQFYSFDCEMTGLFLQGQQDHMVDDVSDRYTRTAAAAEQFLVVQFGLSLFKWTGSSYEARSFNFHLFPSPYEDMDLRFMSQASSLAFLATQGFDFNKMVYEGVPYLPLSWREKQLKASADALKAAAVPSLEELDEDEACLMEQLESSISNWLAQHSSSSSSSGGAGIGSGDHADGSSSSTLYLPAPPPQLQKLQRQLLAAGIGSSRWRRSSSSSSSPSSGSEVQYIVLQQDPSGGTTLASATAADVAAAAASHTAHRVEEISVATGFSQVLELLRDSSKPAVGHNIRFDLAYCLAAFVQNPLPKTWAGYKDLVGQWFPGGVFDTKYLAQCLPSSSSSSRVLTYTGLGVLYSLMAQGNPAAPVPLGSSSSSSSMSSNIAAWLQEQTLNLDNPLAWQTLPPITHAPGCEAYAAAAAAVAPSSSSSSSSSSLAHEAGYDAFMTGVLFVGLLRLFEISGLCQQSKWQRPQFPSEPCCLEAVQQYAWRQYHARGKDVQYAALQGPEVVPQRPEVVYLTGFSRNTRWQDLQAKLQKLGVGKPPVSFVKAQGYSAPATGAYIIMPSAKQASKALQLIRADKTWKVQAMSYIDYWYSQHGKSNKNNNSSTVVRPAPVAVQAAEPAEEQYGDAGSTTRTAAVLQELQHKTAAALQRKAEEEQLKEQYKDWVVQFEQQQQQQEEEDSSAGSSSSDNNAELTERQHRLQQLQKTAAVRPLAAEAAAQLKRPRVLPRKPGQ